jgi:DNA ligase D-like protein (predicted ligase)
MKVTLKTLPEASLQFVQPMLAKAVDRLPEKGDWLYELKLDGYRSLAMKKHGTLTLLSRRGNNLNKRFPLISEAFNFLPDNTIVDGEIVALDRQGKPSFSALQNSLRGSLPFYFYAFDLLAYAGKDVRRLPLVKRRGLLEEYALVKRKDPVRLSPVFSTTPKQLIAAAKKSGLEGSVAKRARSPYETGERSGAWVKYKTNKGQELVIAGYKPGTVGFDYLLAGYYQGKNLIFIGKIKNGFTPAVRRKVTQSFKGLKTKICPFTNLPEPQSARRGEALTAEVMKQIQWLRPKLVAQIEFTEWTKENHLRHSRFVALRDDKKPREVTKEASNDKGTSSLLF